MAASSLGNVYRQKDRWRVDLPLALVGLSAIGLFAGRRRPWLLWGSLGVAAAAGAAFWLGSRSLQWDVAVDKWGVRLVSDSGEKIDLGIPASIRQGRHEGGLLPRNWVAVEADGGKVFLFESESAMFGSGYADWPREAPPDAAETFSSLTFDLAALRAAVWSAMLR